jgi:hypothetical protein
MQADQTATLGALLLLLLLGLMGAFAGLGIMLSGFTQTGKTGEQPLGPRVGKIAVVFVGGLAVVFWLAAPGTGQGIAGTINAMWGNIVTGLQPLVAIVTQLAMLAALGVVGFYTVRHFLRHR